jgi:photosystem II stability/assembly factor-like uncharacterized protein
MKNIRFSLLFILCLSICVVSAQGQWQLLHEWSGGWDINGPSMGISPLHPESIYVGYDRVFISPDKGQTWQKIEGLIGGLQTIIAGTSPPIIYLATNDPSRMLGCQYLLVSRDGLTTQNTPVGAAPFQDLAIALDPTDERTFYYPVGDRYLMRSNDDARTVDTVSQLPAPPIKGYLLPPIIIARSNPNVFYAGAQEGLFRSSDKGQTWNLLAADGNFGWGYNNVAVDEFDENLIYNTGGKSETLRLRRSTDGGTTWNRCGDPSLSEPIGHDYLITSQLAKDEIFWSVTLNTSEQGRLLRSTNRGETWTDYTPGLPDTYYYVSGMVFDKLNKRIYILVSRGISTKLYVMDRIVMSTKDKAKDVPTSIVLSQNYPNPFNPTTTIRYGIPEKSRVTMEIYNTIGVLVDRLYEGIREAGYFSQLWTPAAPSGMYFCRITVQPLEQGNNISTNVIKMVYMR